MAISTQNMEIDPEGLEVLGSMNRAIPGESLTANPDESKTWEQPPEYTNMKDALEYILSKLIEEKTYLSIVGAIGKGIPISDVVQQVLYIGFNQGKWNPDMMLLLIEPLMYLVMSLCEKAGVEYVLYRGEEEDKKDLNRKSQIIAQGEELGSLAKMIEKKAEAGTITSASIPREIATELAQIEAPESLMARPAEQEIPTAPSSLLAANI